MARVVQDAADGRDLSLSPSAGQEMAPATGDPHTVPPEPGQARTLPSNEPAEYRGITGSPEALLGAINVISKRI